MSDPNAITEEFFPPQELPLADSESISARTVVDVAGLSHPGKVRTNNEDSFLVTRFGRSMHTVQTNLPLEDAPRDHSEIGYAMMVADGVGGAAGGEIASRTAIKTLIALAIETPDWIMRLNDRRGKRVMQRMEERLNRLKYAFVERINADPSLTGMGTTATAALSVGSDLIISHVGDSRAYLFTANQLLRLTKDQTMAQLLADLGVIKKDEVEIHHARHVLTSAITAGGDKTEVELHQVMLADGDQLVLCSDGLTEMLSDAELADVLKKNQPANTACQELLDLALEAGGKDNITIVVARYRIPSE